MPSYKNADFERAIEGSNGLISEVAKRVGCTWVTAKNRIDKSAKLSRMLADERERMADYSEHVIHRAIAQDDVNEAVKTAKWYLARVRPERFTEATRHEVRGSGDDGELVLRIVDDTRDARG